MQHGQYGHDLQKDRDQDRDRDQPLAADEGRAAPKDSESGEEPQSPFSQV
jgi:hypothetical protein